MLNIETGNNNYGLPLLRLGFRPFFFGAALFSVIATLVWMIIYVYDWQADLFGFDAATWHAHEMIFGYATGVIAGFLLTAIKNWTGRQTLRGAGLLILFILWAIARLIPITGLDIPVQLLALCDISFMVFMVIAAAVPIIKARQVKQFGIIAILVLLLLCNVVFYADVLGKFEYGMRWGVYSGLYIIMLLVFIMARRVLPFFIERGVDQPVTIINRGWLDISSLLLFVMLWLFDVFALHADTTALLAAILFVLHAIRLTGWYTALIWSKPLLWVLFLAYAFFVLGFAFKAAGQYIEISPFLALHAWTYGGIGLLTIGMMSRVILGHTGRNVSEPPSMLTWCFLLLFIGALFRVVFPLLNMDLYIYWVGASQLLWIIAFLFFLFVYTPMLVKARIDGQDG